MPLPKRSYHRVATAAEVLGCPVDDLVHWAVVRQTRLGVLFSADSFDPPWIMTTRTGPLSNSQVERLEDFDGFAYVDGDYLLEAERTGEFQFNSVQLPDGRVVMFAPEQYVHGSIHARVSDLFIHEREFAALRNEAPLPRSSVVSDAEAMSSKGRNTALCIVAALARLSKLDLAQPYKAADIISSQLDEMGVRLTQEAIAGWLKDVASAISARTK